MVEGEVRKILPECKQLFTSIDGGLEELRDEVRGVRRVVYEDGLLTRMAVMETRLEALDTRVGKMVENLSKLIWIVVGLVLTVLVDMGVGIYLTQMNGP
jgi:hypothetical protein